MGAFIFDQDCLSYEPIMVGITNTMVQSYLDAHPEWEVTFYSINGFFEQPGYLELLKSKLEKQITFAFPGVPAEDICILLPSQGVPQDEEEQIEPLRREVSRLQQAMPQYNMTLVFNNKDNGSPWVEPSDKTKVPDIASNYTCRHIMATPVLEWPQTDYNVYVYHGNGTAKQAGYEKIVRAAGKAYRSNPSWDQTEEAWTGRPPAGKLFPVGEELPRFVGRLVANVLAGKAEQYDLTVLRCNSSIAI